MKLKSLKDIRYFFQWVREVLRTWFTPYHFDDEEDEAPKKPAPAKSTSAKPDFAKKPAAPAATAKAQDEQAAYEKATGDEPAAKSESGWSDPRPETTEMVEVMAFRGPVTPNALASILKRSRTDVQPELDSLIHMGIAEELDDGRYFLVEHERRQVLQNDTKFVEWMSALKSPELERELLDVIEQVCRQLSVKINIGRNVIFHLRQQKWMVWQSRENTCRVRLYGTLSREQWQHLVEIDSGARRKRRKDGRGWDPQDWVSFHWQAGADTLAVESILIEAGREFQKRARRRRGSGKRRNDRKTPAASGTKTG